MRKVIVDTCIWSLALRRANPNETVCRELTSLIEDQRIALLGPVRQEVLSGYSDEKMFERLRSHLSHFENEPILEDDYVQAARFHSDCRGQGIQGSHTDFLICACSFRLSASIYTADQDFRRYATVLPVCLHSSGNC